MERKEFLKSLGLGDLGLTTISIGQVINHKPVRIYELNSASNIDVV